jgi:hypothetical protein
VIPFGVELGGHLEYSARTELHAELASLAAIHDQMDLAARDLHLFDIERYTPIAHGDVHSQAFRRFGGFRGSKGGVIDPEENVTDLIIIPFRDKNQPL